jgi:hypothetical protein
MDEFNNRHLYWEITRARGNLSDKLLRLGLRQAGDVVAGIAQSHDLAPTWQQDTIIERASPDGNRLQTCDQLSAFRNVLNVQFAFSSVGPGAAISGLIVSLS